MVELYSSSEYKISEIIITYPSGS